MEWQDEGPRGTRPSAPQDQPTASTYIFGAICPVEGKAAGLVLPWCNTEAMTLHLAEISARVEPGRHAALLVDQAGWYLSAQLVVPANMADKGQSAMKNFDREWTFKFSAPYSLSSNMFMNLRNGTNITFSLGKIRLT